MKASKDKLILKYVSVDTLKLAKYNPRQITEEELRRLTNSIEDYGFIDPIIVNQVTRNVIGGHQRIKAAKKLKIDLIPAIYIRIDKHREMAMNIALNNPNLQGKFDMPKLRDLIEEINTGEFDMSITGFDEDELEAIMTFEYEPDDIENIDGFGESYNFIIKCADEEEFEQIQEIFKSTGQRIKAETVFELLKETNE